MSVEIQNETAFHKVPEAVIFDTDNTIYPYEPAHRIAMDATEEKATQLLGVSRTQFQYAYREARNAIKKHLGETASSHSRLLYFQRAIETLGLRTQLLLTLDLEQTYWRTFLSSCEIFPEVRDFIHDIRSRGIHTAIITDLTSQIQFRKIIYFGLDTLFDYVVTSEEAGVDKPAGVPFEIALEKLKVAPERVWMIGDSATNDIRGARVFGMVTLQKCHQGVLVGKDDCAADIVFHEFSELRRFFRKRYPASPDLRNNVEEASVVKVA